MPIISRDAIKVINWCNSGRKGVSKLSRNATGGGEGGMAMSPRDVIKVIKECYSIYLMLLKMGEREGRKGGDNVIKGCQQR